MFTEHLIRARYWASDRHHLTPNKLEKGAWSSSRIDKKPCGSEPCPRTPAAGGRAGNVCCAFRISPFHRKLFFPVSSDAAGSERHSSLDNLPKATRSRHRQPSVGLSLWAPCRELFGERVQWDLAHVLPRRRSLREQGLNALKYFPVLADVAPSVSGAALKAKSTRSPLPCSVPAHLGLGALIPFHRPGPGISGDLATQQGGCQGPHFTHRDPGLRSHSDRARARVQTQVSQLLTRHSFEFPIVACPLNERVASRDVKVSLLCFVSLSRDFIFSPVTSTRDTGLHPTALPALEGDWNTAGDWLPLTRPTWPPQPCEVDITIPAWQTRPLRPRKLRLEVQLLAQARVWAASAGEPLPGQVAEPGLRGQDNVCATWVCHPKPSFWQGLYPFRVL